MIYSIQLELNFFEVPAGQRDGRDRISLDQIKTIS